MFDTVLLDLGASHFFRCLAPPGWVRGLSSPITAGWTWAHFTSAGISIVGKEKLLGIGIGIGIGLAIAIGQVFRNSIDIKLFMCECHRPRLSIATAIPIPRPIPTTAE